jgi:methylated-DNA-[protein]-cysteine S-methyltransferase
MRNNWFDTFETSWGWMAVLTSAKGLRCISLPQRTERESLELLGINPITVSRSSRDLKQIISSIQKYFSGEPIKINIPLDFSYTPTFFMKALVSCQEIPFGEKRSYGWIAKKSGNPRAARAAGQAMARNPFPIIVPCHRVILGDGSLHHYGGGLAMKSKLLDLEREPR